MLDGIAGSNPVPSVCNSQSIVVFSVDAVNGTLKMQFEMATRKRPEKTKPTPPKEDVVEKLDKEHSNEDFIRDLEKATSNEARKKLGLPSGRGRGSARK